MQYNPQWFSFVLARLQPTIEVVEELIVLIEYCEERSYYQANAKQCGVILKSYLKHHMAIEFYLTLHSTQWKTWMAQYIAEYLGLNVVRLWM